MGARRARIYDLLALCVAVVVVSLDQWTKALIVEQLSPPQSKEPIPLIGQYLTIYYIQNRGAAFSMLTNSSLLIVLIALAIVVIAILYARMINSGPLSYKLVFGMIIGGAVGNLIDRARHSGYVVDFIWFRIPEVNYSFAIFNVADACISVGVVILFLLLLLSGWRRDEKSEQVATSPSTSSSGAVGTQKQDAQS